MKLIKEMTDYINKLNEADANKIIANAEYMLDRFEGKMSKDMEAELKAMILASQRIIDDLRDTRTRVGIDTNPERPSWKIRKDDRDFSNFERRAYTSGYWHGFRDAVEQIKQSPIGNQFRFGFSHNEP